ncbi:hypothetical protein [Pseudomonas sp. UBA1879]|uniref:hypothetical protein n=1 Tax=Pseudomonas sp. UBA1879 TaxID=1947305 RepID=UPI0025D0B943|nr:hypothetical protein [Pseudomonas sp. UBA1879]
MRGYMQLIDFMRALSDGVQEYLPEAQRTAIQSLDEVVDCWMEKKSCLAIRSLERDIVSFIKKDEAGDGSVYEMLSWYDLLFALERFGCDETVLLLKVLSMIRKRVSEEGRSVTDDIWRWMKRKAPTLQK